MTTPSDDNPLTRLLRGRASAPAGKIAVHLSARDGQSLHDKMRQAYWWITNNAVICPYYDIEFGARSAVSETGSCRPPSFSMLRR